MSQLPDPSEEARQHSRKLVASLRSEIEQTGPMPFSTYMSRVLYTPGMGYYASGNTIFGEAGDFVTAPETSRLFGQCLAGNMADVIAETSGDVLEFGGGTGALAATVLPSLERLGSLPGRYLILEPSAPLAERQRQKLAELPAHLQAKVAWLSALPEAFDGVIVANEVLDAMPVERFSVNASGLADAVVVVWEQDQLQLATAPAADVIQAELRRLEGYLGHGLQPGYTSELSLMIHPWLQALGEIINRGLVLVIDYGYPRTEYYLPERSMGTLRCYYRHHSHGDVLFHPGLQDLTADVDFTRVAEAAVEANLDVHGYTSQARFLLASGLLEHAQVAISNADNDREVLGINRQISYLASGQSGERFQVMGLSRNLDIDLPGFAGGDQSSRL